MRSDRLLLSVLPLLAAVCACSSDECDGNRNALPYAGFYSSEPSPMPLSLDSVTIYGQDAPNDSMILSDARNVSSVYLPFRIDDQQTTFFIQYNQTELAQRDIVDRITFTYEAQPFFVSAACGVSYRYHIRDIDYTRHVIDSVTVSGMLIDNTNAQNIHIYFRVDTES